MRERLDRIVPLREAHLRRAILEYVQHYHQERSHQGLENVLITPNVSTKSDGNVVRRGRLGGLQSFYLRAAA